MLIAMNPKPMVEDQGKKGKKMRMKKKQAATTTFITEWTNAKNSVTDVPTFCTAVQVLYCLYIHKQPFVSH